MRFAEKWLERRNQRNLKTASRWRIVKRILALIIILAVAWWLKHSGSLASVLSVFQ